MNVISKTLYSIYFSFLICYKIDNIKDVKEYGGIYGANISIHR